MSPGTADFGFLAFVIFSSTVSSVNCGTSAGLTSWLILVWNHGGRLATSRGIIPRLHSCLVALPFSIKLSMLLKNFLFLWQWRSFQCIFLQLFYTLCQTHFLISYIWWTCLSVYIPSSFFYPIFLTQM